MKSLSILALLLAAAHAAQAADAAPPAAPVTPPMSPGTWQTSAELGAISTTGNTEGTSITGKIDSRQELENWSNEYIATGFFKEDDITQADGSKKRERSADRFSVSARAGYKLLKPGDKAFVLVSHVKDTFGAYTRYSSINVGHSSQWYRSPTTTFDAEIGPGYFKGRRFIGNEESGLTVRGAGTLRMKLSDTAQFSQTLSVERGTSNTHSAAETALSTKIIDRMQMKAAFVARSDTNVSPGVKKLDTQTSLTLVYSF